MLRLSCPVPVFLLSYPLHLLLFLSFFLCFSLVPRIDNFDFSTGTTDSRSGSPEVPYNLPTSLRVLYTPNLLLAIAKPVRHTTRRSDHWTPISRRKNWGERCVRHAGRNNGTSLARNQASRASFRHPPNLLRTYQRTTSSSRTSVGK